MILESAILDVKPRLTDELAGAPLKFIDNLHDRPDRAPADIRLL